MSSATKAPGAEGPGAYGIPGLPDRLSQSDQLRIFSAYYVDSLPAEAAAELCELADEWDEQIASAPAPSDPAGAGGDLGELERLSKAATPGMARAYMDKYRLRVGPEDSTFETEFTTVAVTSTCDKAGSNLVYLAALWNAHRSGQLVASTPGQKGAGEEKTGASSGPGSREPGPSVPASGFDPSRGFAEIRAKQATLGLGLVDITIIRHEGKAGVLFSPRGEHVEFGDEGRIEAGEHWPGPDDIVLWVEGKGPRVAISHLAQLGPEGPPAMSEWEALEVIGQLPAALTADEHASAFRSAATRCASTAPARSRRLDARADKIELALRTLHAAGEVRHG